MTHDQRKHNLDSSWLIYSNIIISLPTFIIAECVLIYIDPESSRAIVGWASKTFSTAIFFLYEQVTRLFKLRSLFYFDLSCFFWFVIKYIRVVVLYEFLAYMVLFTPHCGASTDSSWWCFLTADDQKLGGLLDYSFSSICFFIFWITTYL